MAVRSGVKAPGGAVGVSEAPRGTLFHHYKVDENGLIEKVNLIIATGPPQQPGDEQNHQPKLPKHYIHGEEIPEGDSLNRCGSRYSLLPDPLSILLRPHAAGQMPLHIELLANRTGKFCRKCIDSLRPEISK